MVTKAMNVRFEYDELTEVREAIRERRENVEKIRKKMEEANLDPFAAANALEVLDRCRVAIGDEPENLFGVDTSTGEIIA